MFDENEQSWEQEENRNNDPIDIPRETYTPPVYPPVKKEKKPLSSGKVVALALCCSLIGGVLGAGAYMLSQENLFDDNNANIYQGNRENSVIDIVNVDTSKKMTAAEVYATNVNSTVGITTSVTTNFWGYQTTSPASGSGFVLSDDGYIITNYHVIENSNSITVTFYDSTSLPAQIVGYDASNDIAVLKVDAKNLKPVTLGDSANINVGDEVIAIGNPLGELTFSLTRGVVSALDRQVTTSNNATMSLIQTDCAINSGNSGGALFNLYGEVIGITNAKYSGNSSSGASIDNIGFAIPVNRIRTIVEDIIEKGFVSKPYIGVRVGTVSEEAQRYGLPKGAALYEIAENSPAEDAGLQVNDIVVAIDEKEITSGADMINIVSDAKIGQVMKFTVYRNSNYIDVNLTVGEQTQSAIPTDQQTTNSNNFFNPFG